MSEEKQTNLNKYLMSIMVGWVLVERGKCLETYVIYRTVNLCGFNTVFLILQLLFGIFININLMKINIRQRITLTLE